MVRSVFLLATLLILIGDANAQFYTGMEQTFGKSRVQYDDFFWTYYKFDRYRVYYSKGGADLAEFTARKAEDILKSLEKQYDYEISDNVFFVVYNKIGQYHQSNIGASYGDESDLGGVTKIVGTKVFLYFEGDHSDLENQIRAGLTRILINRMMYGENWKEIVKNTTLLTVPEWYIEGLVSLSSREWDSEIDNRVKDGVQSGRYAKFNRLSGADARYAGHALWNYISEVYGPNVIPNILYMSRISRNIESGFLFVLGMSIKTLKSEYMSYYRKKYEIEDEVRDLPKEGLIDVRFKKSKIYKQPKSNDEVGKIAFATSELGQIRVYLYDEAKGRKKKILKVGHKLDRVNDEAYPLIEWNPTGEYIAIAYEKKGQTELVLHMLDNNKKIVKNVYKVDKILDMNFSHDGKRLVFSALKNGQSDIYIYTVSSNSTVQITDDPFADLNPEFTNKSTKIIFSSNRTSDTLSSVYSFENDMNAHFDLFSYNYKDGNDVLTRLTNTELINETQPSQYPNGQISFLSDANGIINQYVGHFDSVISHVDTIMHYRYFTQSNVVTNYKRNILEQNVALNDKVLTQVIYSDGSYRLYKSEVTEVNDIKSEELENTGHRNEFELKSNGEENLSSNTNNVSFEVIAIPKDNDDEKINIDDYHFDVIPEQQKLSVENALGDTTQVGHENPKDSTRALPSESRFITLTAKGAKESEEEFELPNKKDYNLTFTASDVTTQFNFDYLLDMYQLFNGGPYFRPGLGMNVKIDMQDIFENYKVTAGVRASMDLKIREYYLGFEDKINRMDKCYSIERRETKGLNSFGVRVKLLSHGLRAVYSYPFSEVLKLETTLSARNDRLIVLSQEQVSLEAPDAMLNWGGLKSVLVFDNTIKKGFNLYNGLRFKIWGESYEAFTMTEGLNVNVLGFDFRHYKKIHRDLIWANRIAASTSFGQGKLVYYMGGVDQWAVQYDAQIFDYDTKISRDQNYIFQSIATNMRGFLQNARNGNSFVLLNSELRLPVFKYFMNKPIKSDFIKNFQVIAFGDFGTAWTGRNPYDDDNIFNNQEIKDGPLKVIIRNQKDPFIGSFGTGFRSRLWGYFVKLDYAWAIEDGSILGRSGILSLGLDF